MCATCLQCVFPIVALQEFSKLCGDKAQLMMLLERINSPFVRSNTSVLQALMRLIPFLAFGEEDKMLALIDHFKSYLDFSKLVYLFPLTSARLNPNLGLM